MSDFHSKEPRLNMSQLLQANFNGNPRLRRIANAFSWRQVRSYVLISRKLCLSISIPGISEFISL